MLGFSSWPLLGFLVHFARGRGCEEGTLLPSPGEPDMNSDLRKVTAGFQAPDFQLQTFPPAPGGPSAPRGVRWCLLTALESCGQVWTWPHRGLCPAGLPGLCVVWRVPGGFVVGRRVPHPLRPQPDPQEAAAQREGPRIQAEVAAGGETARRPRRRVACGDHLPGPSDHQPEGDAAEGDGPLTQQP